MVNIPPISSGPKGPVPVIIGNVLSTLESNEVTAQEALDDIQAQLEAAELLK